MNIADRIMYEDREIFVINKPAGVAVESARVTEPDLASLLRAYSGKEVYIVHRLDQAVSGIVVFARTKRAASVLSGAFQRGETEKVYRAKVSGCICRDRDTLTDWLMKDGRTNTSRVVPGGTKGAKKAVLEYVRTGEQELRIRLMTGRHHQIRVQLSHAGMPILGDRKYGGETCYARGKIALCAERLTFAHPGTGEKMTFETVPDF